MELRTPMLRSCEYCGRYHDDRNPCEPKKIALKQREERRLALSKARRHNNSHSTESNEYRRTRPEYQFRSSAGWTKRSLQVRERDHFLCLCCAAGLRGTTKRYNDGSDSGGLQVHHIIPITEDDSLRLDESNLITVCSVHHNLCELGLITRRQQQQLVEDSIKKAQAIGVQGF